MDLVLFPYTFEQTKFINSMSTYNSNGMWRWSRHLPGPAWSLDHHLERLIWYFLHLDLWNIIYSYNRLILK